MSDHGQLTRADLANMTSEDIAAAHEDGRLELITGATPEDVALIDRARNGFINPEDVKALRAIGRDDLIVNAHNDGRINPNGDAA